MDKVVKAYATFRSKWVPSNRIESFLPFISYVVVKENLTSCTSRVLIMKVEDSFGLVLNTFTTRSVLAYMVNDGLAKKHPNENYSFDIKAIQKKNIISDHEYDLFTINYERLIEGFINYCGD
ncbi:MAG: hypothetical protein U1C51_08890, partial [Candidatus Izemoplasmatales bacterium]|nr:hypothetical protein [Candidatus Izemoplasmatales bacterium]